ncbi:hypothetical protein [Streptomyces sp. SH5]|nr:hypothetical protein [Streptomyces sp. SH5]WGP13099.1 hypothetical protein QFA72_27210 [Streptomyces sp. SH5]GGP88241.1 hypothetical protein GCM10010231_66890 [Streptomyces sindenensis]
MKRIIAAAALALAGCALAAPAHADTAPVDGPVNATEEWDFATPVGPAQEIAKVPVLSPYLGVQKNNAANGNVLDHARIPSA